MAQLYANIVDEQLAITVPARGKPEPSTTPIMPSWLFNQILHRISIASFSEQAASAELQQTSGEGNTAGK